MRVILTTAYCNQKRSESAVDLVDDFGVQEELLGEEENDLSTANDAKSESQPNHCFVGCATSSSDTLPEELEHSSNDLERKLPATRREEPSLKRKLPSLESQGSLKKSAADSNDDSKKPAAKMTAGRYASDERDPRHAVTLRNFSKALKERGLEIREQEGDGNCLFRAVSLQVYGDPSMHMDVRHQCLDHMAKDEEHFSQFVEDEDFSKYLKRKRTAGVHGNNPEIQAISELFNRPVEVFTPDNGATPLNIFQSEYKTSDVPIRLSYQDKHYDAVVDPLLPTAGLGLGLPGLQPGLADKMQMEKAVRESDQMADQANFKRVLQESHNDELQRAIKESALSVDRMYNDKALALSDMEATDFDLEQAVLESSLAAFHQQEAGHKLGAAARSVREPESSSIFVSHTPPVAAASPFAVAPAAAAASVPQEEVSGLPSSTSTDEYPPTVQELVMNGFELSKVIRAYELIGDNFDDLLLFLMNTNT
ncbi:cysteine protease [Fragilaria crotonensis]|nr:cysteine protease [Fragilaria crotonensis]